MTSQENVPTESTESTESAVEVESTDESTKSPEVGAVQKLTKNQQHGALVNVFDFLSAFDRVPGSQALNWGRVLETLATVANNLARELKAEDE